MASLVNVTALFNDLPVMPARLQRAIAKVVRRTAFAIMRDAQTQHPFKNDTGFAEASIYVVTARESTYGQGIDAMPPGGALLPSVPAPTSRTFAYVAWGANYGIYLELGTRHAPAFPTLGPAAEQERAEYLAALAEIEGELYMP